MQQITEGLKNQPMTNIVVLQQKDRICDQCPNLSSNQCTLGDMNVLLKDQQVLAMLQLEAEEQYVYRDVIDTMKSNMTKEAFECCCAGCRWFKDGICSYKELYKNLLEVDI